VTNNTQHNLIQATVTTLMFTVHLYNQRT